MTGARRKDKEMTDFGEMKENLKTALYYIGDPQEIIKKQPTLQSIQKVKIGRIDIDHVSDKKLAR